MTRSAEVGGRMAPLRQTKLYQALQTFEICRCCQWDRGQAAAGGSQGRRRQRNHIERVCRYGNYNTWWYWLYFTSIISDLFTAIYIQPFIYHNNCNGGISRMNHYSIETIWTIDIAYLSWILFNYLIVSFLPINIPNENESSSRLDPSSEEVHFTLCFYLEEYSHKNLSSILNFH